MARHFANITRDYVLLTLASSRLVRRLADFVSVDSLILQ